MPKNWNRRFKHNRDKIKTGDIYELAEVVRNLSLRESEKGLSTGEKQMFTRTKKILASELMYALDKDEERPRATSTSCSPTRPPARWRWPGPSSEALAHAAAPLAVRLPRARQPLHGDDRRPDRGRRQRRAPRGRSSQGARRARRSPAACSGASTRCAAVAAIEQIVVALPPGVGRAAGRRPASRAGPSRSESVRRALARPRGAGETRCSSTTPRGRCSRRSSPSA